MLKSSLKAETEKKIDKEKMSKKIKQNLLVSFTVPFFCLLFFFKLHFTVEMQTTLASYGSILLGALLLRHHLLTFH